MAGKAIGQVAGEMGSKIFGLHRSSRDYLEPDHNWTLEIGDCLLILEEECNLNAEFKVRHTAKKVLIVDDNSVILKLYTRLFNRAGFNTTSATNGHAALDLITREKPDAAVIDFNIPSLSGIEVCEAVRANQDYDSVKLILFTADEEPETRPTRHGSRCGCSCFEESGSI